MAQHIAICAQQASKATCVGLTLDQEENYGFSAPTLRLDPVLSGKALLCLCLDTIDSMNVSVAARLF